MLMRNYVKERLEKKGVALGAVMASANAMNCECVGLNGYDFAVIDCEHAQTDAETVVDMARACELYEMSALVRVYDPNDYPMLSRLLDVGVHGLVVPAVETAAQAKNIIDAVKYAPLGRRGANGGRGPRWGVIPDYTKQANDALYTIMTCETIQGLENIEAIAQTPGLDCIVVGTKRLALEFGGDNQKVEEAITKVLDACQKNNITPGMMTECPEEAAARVKQGFKLVTCLNDMKLFNTAVKNQMQAVLKGLE